MQLQPNDAQYANEYASMLTEIRKRKGRPIKGNPDLGAQGELALAYYDGPETYESTIKHLKRVESDVKDDFKFDFLSKNRGNVDVKTVSKESIAKGHDNLVLGKYKIHDNVTYALMWELGNSQFEFVGFIQGNEITKIKHGSCYKNGELLLIVPWENLHPASNW